MKLLRLALLVSLFALPLLAAAPNIVLILIDDMGWADIGCNGSEFYRTPNLDRMAAQGVRFTQGYAACPVCSPTRASILTGKYPARLHLTDWLPGRADRPDQKLARPNFLQELPVSETTLPEILKEAGYATASIGKWHLGNSPTNHGFDLNIAGDQRGSPPGYFYPFKGQGPNAKSLPGLEQGEPDEYLTDRLTAEAEKFIRTNRARPFFLYLPHYAVHIPLGAPTNLVRQAAQRQAGPHQTNYLYATMVEKVDQGVGRILDTLDSLQLADNTVVIFTSDNGGLSVREGAATPATSNHPLRAGKGYLYEGGIRVPLLVKYPKKIPAGLVSHVPVSSIDLLPTILELAGVQTKLKLDGVSWLSALEAESKFKRDALYWHYPHYSNQGGKPGGAIRAGNFKLIEHYEDGAWELFNLATDPSETQNVADSNPKVAADLARKLDAWRRVTEAQMPRLNPNYSPKP